MPGRSYFAPDSKYRFGFNGYENENDWNDVDGGMVDFGARIHDPRLGRFLSIDPLFKTFSWQSPYAFAANNPIRFIDVNGEGPGDGPFSGMSYLDKSGVVVFRITTSDRVSMEITKAVAENINIFSLITATTVDMANMENAGGIAQNTIEEVAKKGMEKAAEGTIVTKALDISASSVSNYGDVYVDVAQKGIVRPGLKAFAKKIPIIGAAFDAKQIYNNSDPTRMEVLVDFTFEIANGGSPMSGFGNINIVNESLFHMRNDLISNPEEAEKWMNNLYNIISEILPEEKFDLTTDKGRSSAFNTLIENQKNITESAKEALPKE